MMPVQKDLMFFYSKESIQCIQTELCQIQNRDMHRLKTKISTKNMEAHLIKKSQPITNKKPIAKGNRIIITTDLRREVRNHIHLGHQDAEKCPNREYVSWLGITAIIKDMLSNCRICLDEHNQWLAKPIFPYKIPEIPRTKFGTDIFELLKNVIAADNTTMFFNIDFLTNEQSSFFIIHLKSMFGKSIILQTVIRGNNLEFKANKLKIFSKEWYFQYDTSTALKPQPNAIVEPIIQTVKRPLKKATKTHT